MENVVDTFSQICRYNEDLRIEEVRNVLILYEEQEFFIGDTCLKFDQLKICRQFFANASISINCLNSKYLELYKNLLKNNPHVDHLYNLTWEEIDFSEIDVVLCATYDEVAFMHFLQEKYGPLISGGLLDLAVFSITAYILRVTDDLRTAFPVNKKMVEYAASVMVNRPYEIYLSQEERTWGNQWLSGKGLDKDERLVVVVDTASKKEKLLRTDVYFDVLVYLLSLHKTKVLVFDEGSVGKAEFYQEWLTKEQFSKMIFSTGLGLRKDLCILSADRTSLILGPCTGLLHCASGMYNYFSRTSAVAEKIPLMITYTGVYQGDNETADQWWGKSPLIQCLVLKDRNGHKDAVLLGDLSEEERKYTGDLLPCREYSSEMLIDFIRSRFAPQP